MVNFIDLAKQVLINTENTYKSSKFLDFSVTSKELENILTYDFSVDFIADRDISLNLVTLPGDLRRLEKILDSFERCLFNKAKEMVEEIKLGKYLFEMAGRLDEYYEVVVPAEEAMDTMIEYVNNKFKACNSNDKGIQLICRLIGPIMHGYYLIKQNYRIARKLLKYPINIDDIILDIPIYRKTLKGFKGLEDNILIMMNELDSENNFYTPLYFLDKKTKKLIPYAVLFGYHNSALKEYPTNLLEYAKIELSAVNSLNKYDISKFREDDIQLLVTYAQTALSRKYLSIFPILPLDLDLISGKIIGKGLLLARKKGIEYGLTYGHTISETLREL